MARYFLEIMYDGTLFHGSQLQGEIPTVQLAIDKTLSILLRKQITSFGASRTDEGVHALCNYFHFDIDEELHPGFIYKMNSILPIGVALKKVYKANDEKFSARFNAIKRTYRYRIYPKKNPFLANRAYYFPFKVDLKILNETASVIKEYDHFESFSKRKNNSKTFKCNISESYWELHGKELQYIVSSNRFLRGMVKGLVGTQLLVGKGKITIDEFKAIIEAKDCTKADFSVPGHGLYLENIEYKGGNLTELTNLK
ncbi:MAG TPA: tRNA pseudouridine synthase A [Flavipsychrobacter sp.]|nr:tRNA pseudouridine synthase A [Flavipsychrobacter sp.]